MVAHRNEITRTNDNAPLMPRLGGHDGACLAVQIWPALRQPACSPAQAAHCAAKLDTILDLLRAHAPLADDRPVAAPPPSSAREQRRFARRVYDLTPREADTLLLLAAGLSNRQIAQELVVSLATVKCHVSNILGKMGVSSRTAAVVLLLRRQQYPEE